MRAAGGNIMGHGSTYRIFLKKAGKNRVATMYDSPYHAYEQIKFSISENGIQNSDQQNKNGDESVVANNASSSQVLERDFYPDPRSLPSPPALHEPLPLVTLSELEPGKYTSTQARVVYLKTLERPDALGEKVVFSGVLEDATSKVSFVSHKISFPLIRDSVYRFDSGYVHEFPDKSLLLVITERTKIDPKNVEDIREFTWNPKIGSINRPVRNVYLNGTVTTIYSTSGLIRW